MRYCFDLDGTLCTNTDGDYENAEPFPKRIAIVNDLHSKGHEIIIETARGRTTGINWIEFTCSQLKKWGVKYSSIRAGIKIDADMFVDDKSVNATDFFSSENLYIPQV